MRWSILLLCLLVLPLAFASEKSGWYYRDEGFVFEGVNYTVLSNDPDRLLLSVDGKTKLIPFGECLADGLSRYCYSDSGYPSDDSHIEYVGGEELYANYLTVGTVVADVDFSQELDDEDSRIGSSTAVTVFMENTGDFSIQQITYEVEVPDGLRSADGSSKIRIVKPSLSVGGTDAMVFRVTPTRYGDFVLSPRLSYQFNGKTVNVSLSDLTVSVDSPLVVERVLTKDLEMDQEGSYSVNFTNNDEGSFSLKAYLDVPQGLQQKSIKGFKSEGSRLVASATLTEDDEESFTIQYLGSRDGDHTFFLTVELTIDGVSTTYKYNDTVEVDLSGITSSLKLSPDRSGFTAGEQVSFKGLLTNTNSQIRFKDISGSLSAPGLFSDVTFGHEEFGEGRTLTEAEKSITLPSDLATATNFTITFSGSYRSPGGLPLSYSSSRTIQVVPYDRDMRLSRTITPLHPLPGDIVHVSVLIINEGKTALTVDAHEKFNIPVESIEGETYASMSIEPDSETVLYEYDFTIPANLTDSLIITTSAREKDSPAPLELSTTVFSPAGSQGDGSVSDDSGSPNSENESETVVEEKQSLGFFAAIKDFFIKIFS